MTQKMSTIAVDIYRAVLQFVHCKNNNEVEFQILNYITDKLAMTRQLNNEVLSQICKQTHKNPDQ